MALLPALGGGLTLAPVCCGFCLVPAFGWEINDSKSVWSIPRGEGGQERTGFCKVMIDASIELVLEEGPALALESPGWVGMLPEDVWASHAGGNVARRRMRIVEAGRKRRIVRAGRRRRVIGVVAGLSKNCQ